VHVFQEHFQHLPQKHEEFKHSLEAVLEDVRIPYVSVEDVGSAPGRCAHLSRKTLEDVDPSLEKGNTLFSY
jgi:hypothetical protein